MGDDLNMIRDSRDKMKHAFLTYDKEGYYQGEPLIDKYMNQAAWLTGEPRAFAWEMANDPSKRGYGPDFQEGYGDKTLSQMFGRQADALAGAKTSYGKNLNRYGSAMGYGGLANKLGEYQKQFDAGLRGAARDTSVAGAEAARTDKLQAAEAKRSDLWNALATYGDATDSYLGHLGKGVDQASQQFRDIQQSQQAYSQIESQKPGFWKSFKTSAGSGLGNFLTS